MRIEESTADTDLLDGRSKVRVLVPDGYDDDIARYPVLYINDGQDIFEDAHTFGDYESLRLADYYRHFGKFMPKVILVAIDAPFDRGRRTALYAPYSKDFNVPEGKYFEAHIDGKGKEYLDWLIGTLKPRIDARYRTLPDRDHTGIAGYSSGALNSLYAVLAHPGVFTRVVGMSSAVGMWMDQMAATLERADYGHIRFAYVDVGTNEYGRITTREEFLRGSEEVYRRLSGNMSEPAGLYYRVHPDAMHTQRDWRWRFPDAIRWVFQDF